MGALTGLREGEGEKGVRKGRKGIMMPVSTGRPNGEFTVLRMALSVSTPAIDRGGRKI
jgi:hypothetical protein